MEKNSEQVGNRLIAEFMEFNIEGNIQVEPHYDRFTGEWEEKESPGTVENLEYHWSWDWLHPVSIKLHTMKAIKKRYPAKLQALRTAIGNSDIETSFEISYTLIQFYNSKTSLP